MLGIKNIKSLFFFIVFGLLSAVSVFDYSSSWEISSVSLDGGSYCNNFYYTPSTRSVQYTNTTTPWHECGPRTGWPALAVYPDSFWSTYDIGGWSTVSHNMRMAGHSYTYRVNRGVAVVKDGSSVRQFKYFYYFGTNIFEQIVSVPNDTYILSGHNLFDGQVFGMSFYNTGLDFVQYFGPYARQDHYFVANSDAFFVYDFANFKAYKYPALTSLFSGYGYGGSLIYDYITTNAPDEAYNFTASWSDPGGTRYQMQHDDYTYLNDLWIVAGSSITVGSVPIPGAGGGSGEGSGSSTLPGCSDSDARIAKDSSLLFDSYNLCKYDMVRTYGTGYHLLSTGWLLIQDLLNSTGVGYDRYYDFTEYLRDDGFTTESDKLNSCDWFGDRVVSYTASYGITNLNSLFSDSVDGSISCKYLSWVNTGDINDDYFPLAPLNSWEYYSLPDSSFTGDFTGGISDFSSFSIASAWTCITDFYHGNLQDGYGVNAITTCLVSAVAPNIDNKSNPFYSFLNRTKFSCTEGQYNPFSTFIFTIFSLYYSYGVLSGMLKAASALSSKNK